MVSGQDIKKCGPHIICLSIWLLPYISIFFIRLWCVHVMPGDKDDYETLARKGTVIIEACYRFRDKKGLFPYEIEDLIPEYLPNAPEDKWWYIEADELSIDYPMPARLEYNIRENAEGWKVVWDYGFRKINVPAPKISPLVVTEEHLNTGIVEEFQRRIRKDPEDVRPYHRLASYLLLRGRLDEAIGICHQGIDKISSDYDYWWPRAAEAILLFRKDGRMDGIEAYANWVEANPSFAHYYYLFYLYRLLNQCENAFDALSRGIEYRLKSYSTMLYEWYVNTEDAVRFAYIHKKYQLVNKMCNELIAKNEWWYLPFRSASYLVLGEVGKAAQDAIRSVEKRDKEYPIMVKWWTKESLERLKNAALSGDTSFVFEFDDWPKGDLFLEELADILKYEPKMVN